MSGISGPRKRKTHCSVCGALLDPNRPKTAWGRCLDCRRSVDNARQYLKRHTLRTIKIKKTGINPFSGRPESEDMGPLSRPEIRQRIRMATAEKKLTFGETLKDMFFGPKDRMILKQAHHSRARLKPIVSSDWQVRGRMEHPRCSKVKPTFHQNPDYLAN